MFDRKISRRYVALVWGEPSEKEGKAPLNPPEGGNIGDASLIPPLGSGGAEGTINVPIGRSKSDRKKMAAFPEGNYGKTAITHYKVLETFKYVSLVECKLETGRTHQIRVHMKHIGHTVFGDIDYGGDKILKSSTDAKYKAMVEKCFQICARQALHAKYLSFEHPTSKKQMNFEIDLPDDMKQVIAIWKNYAK